jgi:hypothetical protein
VAHQEVGVVLSVDVEFYAPASGGRSSAVTDGYRPLCLVPTGEGEKLVTLCELRLEAPVEPGDRAVGLLGFAPQTADDARRLLPPGTEFRLAEGPKTVAIARVRDVLDATEW